MRSLICRKLADLASIRIQHRFIRDATDDFYLLPEDALNDAFNAIELAESSTTLSLDERAAVRNFAAIFNSLEPDLSSNDFFDSDPNWVTLRSAAVKCLEKLGFDLSQYENEEIKRCQQ